MDHDTASFYYQCLNILSKHSRGRVELNIGRFRQWWEGKMAWGGVKREAGVHFSQMDGWKLITDALQFNSHAGVVELMLATWPVSNPCRSHTIGTH